MLGALLAVVAAYSATATSSAVADETFCSNVTLQPYGHAGDRCTAPQGGWVWNVIIYTHERAGCLDIQNNGELLASWTCTGKENSYLVSYYANKWAHGIIRNNNLSFAGVFTGAQNFCSTQGCQ
jgi:hypothetical protein